MENNLVSVLDSAGLPGPPWLFHFLLVLTFFLHMIFMNLTLGGTFLAWFSHLQAKGRPKQPHGVLATRLISVNTFAISLAITTGIAPLLFVQVIYQQFFYSGTILMGWIWFSLLGLLIVGYYTTYLYKFRGMPARGSGGGLWLGLSAVCFLLIAMTQVAVHLIHIQPDKWLSFQRSPWIVLADPTYWPRLLHFILAGVGFSALLMAYWAVRKARAGVDVDINRAVARTCWRWALWTTAAQVLDGFVLTFVLPREVLLGFMRGGGATMLPFMLSILLGIGLLMMLGRAVDPVEKPGLVTGTLAAMALTMATMSITRHQVRILYLDPVTDFSGATILPQWGNFALFVVLLLVALGTVAYMTRRVLSERASGDEAA